MYNKIQRDESYLNGIKSFVCLNYGIDASAITPATRGYWGETWQIDAPCGRYFVKIDYSPVIKPCFKAACQLLIIFAKTA